MYSTSEEGSRTRKGNSELSEGEGLLRQAGQSPMANQAVLYHPCHPSPSSQGSSSISADSQTEGSHILPKKATKADIHCKCMKGYSIFPINSQNFLQNFSCFIIFFLITDSLRALSRWCCCLMYFIFPRIACSQCEECQLFWET